MNNSRLKEVLGQQKVSKGALILAALSQKLQDKGEIGRVVAVITYNQNGVLTNYGKLIPPDKIFATLNASCQTEIRYRGWRQLRSYRCGLFVRLNTFQSQYGDDLWVALVGIPANDPTKAISY